MVTTHFVKGYENLIQLLNKLNNSSNSINILFSGQKDENGVSWCSDCKKHIKQLNVLSINICD